MSSIFLQCWDLFLSLPPAKIRGRHITWVQLLLLALTSTPTPTEPIKFSSVLEHEQQGGKRKTACANLTTKIISWLGAPWAWQVLSWLLHGSPWGVPARIQLRYPCGRPCTSLCQLDPSWSLVPGGPQHTDSLLACHCSFRTQRGSRQALSHPCSPQLSHRKHSCALDLNKGSATLLCPAPEPRSGPALSLWTCGAGGWRSVQRSSSPWAWGLTHPPPTLPLPSFCVRGKTKKSQNNFHQGNEVQNFLQMANLSFTCMIWVRNPIIM